MIGIEVKVRPVALPFGPRETMARLRHHADDAPHALFESALTMQGQAEWSFIAGPALATLYTDETGTHLEREGNIERSWDDPFAALAAITEMMTQRPLHVDVDVDVDVDLAIEPEGLLDELGFIGGWVGVLGYDAARFLHSVPTLARLDPPLPTMCWLAVDQVLAFHHASGRWWHCTSNGPLDPGRLDAGPRPNLVHVAVGWKPGAETDAKAGVEARAQVWAETLSRARGLSRLDSRWRAGPAHRCMDQARFEAGVQTIRDAIAAGDLLQANLTRREDRAFEGDPWALYDDLAAAHPAPFCAFIEAEVRGRRFAIASCSPERFLQVRGRAVQARPIKGTARRGRNADDDAAQRARLAESDKDRAENLMIVDLMRNDLGRVADVGSVAVPSLFALEPYASVWQMVSTVTATLRRDCGLADLLRACWPPGSMTGAPKLAAMLAIETLEPLRRGFYAGSIGYLDCRGHMDLSVVIRSVVVADGRAMLQLGGGVVADSDPRGEWNETLAKGARLTAVLDRDRPGDVDRDGDGDGGRQAPSMRV